MGKVTKDTVYAEVDAGRIQKEDLVLAHTILAQSCEYLGIKAPALRWFNKEGPDSKAHRAKYGADWDSFVDASRLMGAAKVVGNEVWIHADLEGSELVETVAHEVKHLALGGPTGGCTDDLDEAQADEFGKAVRENYEND